MASPLGLKSILYENNSASHTALSATVDAAGSASHYDLGLSEFARLFSDCHTIDLDHSFLAIFPLENVPAEEQENAERPLCRLSNLSTCCCSTAEPAEQGAVGACRKRAGVQCDSVTYVNMRGGTRAPWWSYCEDDQLWDGQSGLGRE